MIRALLAAALFGAGVQGGAPGFSPKAGSSGALPVLTCGSGCAAQWVADDYAAGNWSARVGGWTGTVTGTPVKQATTQFSGRNELTFGSGNSFSVAANAAWTLDTGEAVTWECLVRAASVATGQKILGNYPGAGMYLLNFDTSVGARIFLNNDAGGGFMTTNPFPSIAAGRYYLITYVIDRATPIVEVYVNGTSVGSSTATSGVITPASVALLIGRGDDSPWLGGIVELVMHSVALSAATIAVRDAPFNAAKGY